MAFAAVYTRRTPEQSIFYKAFKKQWPIIRAMCRVAPRPGRAANSGIKWLEKTKGNRNVWNLASMRRPFIPTCASATVRARKVFRYTLIERSRPMIAKILKVFADDDDLAFALAAVTHAQVPRITAHIDGDGQRADDAVKIVAGGGLGHGELFGDEQ